MAHGGRNQWSDHISVMPPDEAKTLEWQDYEFWKGYQVQMVDGEPLKIDGKRQYILMRSDGSMSHPLAKKRLLKYLQYLEKLVVKEEKWEKEYHVMTLPPDYRASLVEAQKTGAIATLKRYKALSKRQNPREVEDASLAYSRKRGREWVAASSADLPDPEDVMEPKHWSITRTQKAFIDAALTNEELEEYDSR